MAIIVAPDGTETTVSPSAGETFTLVEMQGIVGGYIELVTLSASRQM
jgi:hypothetical protein